MQGVHLVESAVQVSLYYFLNKLARTLIYGQLKSILWIDKHVTYTFEVRDEMRYSKRKLLIRIEQADL